MNSTKILKEALKGKYFSENLLLQANAIYWHSKLGKNRLTSLADPGKLSGR